MRLVILAFVLALVASPVLATPLPPVVGVYNSSDIPGGTMLTGRFSESWPGGGPGQLTNTVNAASWNGTQLGTEWRVWCPGIILAPIFIADTRIGGTGDVVWLTYYGGGRFWYSMNGPWSADNLTDFTGSIDQFTAYTTYMYVGGTLLGIRSNITTIGTFDQLYPSWGTRCFDYTINNATFFGSTDTGTKPADFPSFLDPANCPSDVGTLNAGGWGSATQITLMITGCAVPAEPSTWGRIKTRY
jgi:hypothetical protein